MREVRVTLGCKERKLRYDFNGLCDLERQLGRPMFPVISGLSTLPFGDIRDFLWAGIIHENDREASVRAVGEWIAKDLRGGKSLLDFWIVIDEALVQSGVFGDPDEMEKKEAAKGDNQGNAEASQPA